MKESQDSLPETYTLIIGSRPFPLSLSQIEHDAPNYFTSHFLNPSNPTTRLEISRDPDVFELVLKYLNGYHVVPLSSTRDRDGALVDLRADAEFYGLRGLVEICDVEEERDAVVLNYVTVTGHLGVSKDGLSPTEDIEKIVPRFSISPLPGDLFQKATTDMFALTGATAHVSNYLLVSGWSNQIVRGVLRQQAPGVESWEIVGWKRKMDGDVRHAVIFVKVWARPSTFLK